MERADRFIWKGGDVIVTPCQPCTDIADALLSAQTADEVAKLEAEYSEHIARAHREHVPGHESPTTLTEFLD